MKRLREDEEDDKEVPWMKWSGEKGEFVGVVRGDSNSLIFASATLVHQKRLDVSWKDYLEGKVMLGIDEYNTAASDEKISFHRGQEWLAPKAWIHLCNKNAPILVQFRVVIGLLRRTAYVKRFVEWNAAIDTSIRNKWIDTSAGSSSSRTKDRPLEVAPAPAPAPAPSSSSSSFSFSVSSSSAFADDVVTKKTQEKKSEPLWMKVPEKDGIYVGAVLAVGDMMSFEGPIGKKEGGGSFFTDVSWTKYEKNHSPSPPPLWDMWSSERVPLLVKMNWQSGRGDWQSGIAHVLEITTWSADTEDAIREEWEQRSNKPSWSLLPKKQETGLICLVQPAHEDALFLANDKSMAVRVSWFDFQSGDSDNNNELGSGEEGEEKDADDDSTETTEKKKAKKRRRRSVPPILWTKCSANKESVWVQCNYFGGGLGMDILRIAAFTDADSEWQIRRNWAELDRKLKTDEEDRKRLVLGPNGKDVLVKLKPQWWTEQEWEDVFRWIHRQVLSFRSLRPNKKILVKGLLDKIKARCKERYLNKLMDTTFRLSDLVFWTDANHYLVTLHVHVLHTDYAEYVETEDLYVRVVDWAGSPSPPLEWKQLSSHQIVRITAALPPNAKQPLHARWSCDVLQVKPISVICFSPSLSTLL